MNLDVEIKRENGFEYIETDGDRVPLVLLHGLMGALSNFEGIIQNLGKKYNVVVPLLPIFSLPLKKVSLNGLLEYVINFIEFKKYNKIHVLGNSLGGHIAQLYTLAFQDKVVSMTLTGSSGLFENAMGSTFPKRGDYEYIKKKTEMVFYNSSVATKELVDEVYGIVNDLGKALRIVKIAKSAIRHNIENDLCKIKVPTLLVWGKNDEVTPEWVGRKFHELISNSEYIVFDECGHAPMMEKREEFNYHLDKFLQKHTV